MSRQKNEYSIKKNSISICYHTVQCNTITLLTWLIFQIKLVPHFKKKLQVRCFFLTQIKNVLLKWQIWRLLVTVHVVASSVQSLSCAVFLCNLSVQYKPVAAVDPKNVPQTEIHLT